MVWPQPEDDWPGRLRRRLRQRRLWQLLLRPASWVVDAPAAVGLCWPKAVKVGMICPKDVGCRKEVEDRAPYNHKDYPRRHRPIPLPGIVEKP